MHVIGTAGHVDHGKSSLVNALTGTNPDRWLEERLRGMTLDLGFARLRFEGVDAGIVDVPGHERFLHNMLAGAAGMELLLLVVAATEGVMPQTLEHLQILRFLNVREVIVVVTKIDLLPPEQIAAECARISDALAGTIASGAPFVPVSTVTGEGLDDLRSLIRTALQRLPQRDLQAPAYLPIDRVFALPGHGTIVTGTLMQGRIEAGDVLALQPSGKSVRVRSLQTFGERRESVQAGMRVAVNIPGAGAGEIARGQMLVAPQFVPADAFAVDFTPLREALPILRRRNAVRAYIGSAEILGTLVLPCVPQDEAPLRAQLFLRSPTVAYPGTAFVVRRLSPKNVLGGGTIEQLAPQAAPDADSSAPNSETVAAVLAAAGHALTAAEIARAANLRIDVVEETLVATVERGDALRLLRPEAYVSGAFARDVLASVLARLEQLQGAEPWSMGATSLALSRALAIDEALLVRVLDAFAAEGRIARRAGYFATVDHAPKLSAEQLAFFDERVPVDSAAPLRPAVLADVVAAVKASRVGGIGKAFDSLLATGALIKVNADLYRGTQIAQIHARVEQFLRRNGKMTMAEFRDVIGTSRKYAVPLLEWFDARGITVRAGDYRMLRSRAPVSGEAPAPR